MLALERYGRQLSIDGSYRNPLPSSGVFAGGGVHEAGGYGFARVSADDEEESLRASHQPAQGEIKI